VGLVPYLPLRGVKILDISRLYPGALTTKKLADLGADVVKVEEPGRGDYIRTIPPTVEGKGVLHVLLDPGKRSIALDLKQPEGVETFLRLASVADVLVESASTFRFMDMWFYLAAIRRELPRVVVC
jgi:crotonobetainyl-CoA:carnitine CoA-transferase CaiB-like acyl-CoA transferase